MSETPIAATTDLGTRRRSSAPVDGMATTTVLPKRRSLAVNSVGLVAGKAAQMGTGFLFWLVAARLVRQHELGVAQATVSSVMLSTQLGLLGIGAAVIVMLGQKQPLRQVLAPALFLVCAASAVAGAACLAVTSLLSPELSSIVRNPLYMVLFLVAAVFGTVIVCLDQLSVALGRGDHTLIRYATSGSAAILALVVLGASPVTVVAGLVLTCWTIDSVLSSVIGWVQARRWVGVFLRPSFDRERCRELLRIGLPNHLLTLAERAPALLVPILTAHVVSPTATAQWYPAWMMAWVAYTAPVSVGLAQFSDIVRQPHRARQSTATALKWSLLLGGAVAAVLIVGANPLLGLLGKSYAESSSTALRVLALGLVPYALVQTYNAVCRSQQRLREATITSVVLAIVACAATVVAATHSITAMAVAWVTVFSVGAVWCGIRVLVLLRQAPVEPVDLALEELGAT